MTEEQRKTRTPAQQTPEPGEKKVMSRSEVRKAHAATVAETAAEQEKPVRSKRGTEPSAEQPVRSKRSEQPAEHEETDTKPVRWVQIRLLPIYVRVLLVLLLIAAAAIGGAMVGYSILGDGSPGDVFQKETWTHIFDIMSGKE